MQLSVGDQLFSCVCEAEFIVTRAPREPIELTIGGLPPATSEDAREQQPTKDGHAGGCQMGKRFNTPDGGVELLCTKAGSGVPAIDGKILSVLDSKGLPASD